MRRLLIIAAFLLARLASAQSPDLVGRDEIPWTLLPVTHVRGTPIPSWSSFIGAMGASSGNENHFDAERAALITRARQEGLTPAVAAASADFKRRRAAAKEQ